MLAGGYNTGPPPVSFPPSTSRSPGLFLGPNALFTGRLHLARLAAYACFPVFALKQVRKFDFKASIRVFALKQVKYFARGKANLLKLSSHLTRMREFRF